MFFAKNIQENGASDRNRTNDTGIFSPLLYRLSYRGKMATWMGLEPTTSAVTGRRSNQLNYQAEYCAELFLRTIPHHFGGNNRARTYDPLLVRQMLSQLSYAPTFFRLLRFRFVYLSNRLLYYTLILWICQVFFQNSQKNF